MERLERLLNLVAALLAADRPLSRADLVQRVPGYPSDDAALHRAFERDKEALRKMGIPLSVEVVDPDVPEVRGYRIYRDQYELPDPDLAPDELAALHLAVSAVRLEGGEATGAIWKLGGAIAAEASLEVALAGSEHLPVLFRAVSARQPVAFRFRETQRRTVDPWRLMFRGGRWYLVGRDHDRDAERQFRLDRIAEPEAVGEPGSFERRPEDPGPPSHKWEYGSDEPVTARLLIDAAQAQWAVRYVGEQAVAARHGDGSVELALRVTNRAGFRDFALGFLDHAEVLGPPELRDDVVSWLRELV